MRSRFCLCVPFPVSSYTKAVRNKRAVMKCAVMSALLFLGIYVMIDQVRATDEAVDLQHIADLSAQIDLKSSYTAWARHGQQPFSGPSPAHTTSSNSPLPGHIAKGHHSASTLQGQRDTPADRSWNHPNQLSKDAGRSTGELQNVRLSPLLSLLLPNRAEAQASNQETSFESRDKHAYLHPSSSSSLTSKPSSSDSAESREHLRQRTTKEDEPPTEKDFRNSREANADETDTTFSFRQRRSPQPRDALVTRLSAKRLSRLEEDLAKRRQTAPEHKLYHEDLLLRRLKMLHQFQKRGPQNRSPQSGAEEAKDEEEDSWEHELRIRRELADKAVEYGLQKKREREANPDPDRPLSVLERIRKDAEEILQRRAQEKEYLNTMMKNKAGAKTDSFYPKKDSKEKRGEKDIKKKEKTNSLGAVQIMTHDKDDVSAERSVPDAETHSSGQSQSALLINPANIIQKTPPVVSNTHVSSRQRRKMKKHSRALRRTLSRHKRLV